MAYQPKSYKKFVATTATATLVATAVVPAAFADEVKTAAFTDVPASYAPAVDFVVEQAIAKGVSEKQFGITQDIKRGDAAIMIANASKKNNPDAPSSGFTDVPTRGALAINSLKAAGITSGKSATQFDFEGSITRGEAAIFLAKAFALTGDTKNVKFTDVSDRYLAAVAALVDNGVTNGKSTNSFGTGDELTRGEFAKWLFALEEYIVDEKPEVASVTPLNANQLVVDFKTPLNGDAAVAKDATELANYTLDNATPSSAVLSEDKKSVVLTFANDIEGTDQLLVVNPIATTEKDENGAWILTDKYSTVLTYTDAVKPVVTGTSYKDGLVTVNFSEVLSSLPTVVRINNQPVTGAALTNGGKSVTFAYNLNASQTASLYIAGAKDNANTANEQVIYNGSVTAPAADLQKPRVTSVQVTGQNTAKVTLSEDITASTFQAVLQQGATQQDVQLTEDTTDTTGKTYTFSVSELANWNSTDASETYTLFLPAERIQDSAQNKNDFYSTSVTFAKDTAAPVLASSKVAASKQAIELSFNENVTVSTGSVTVRDSQGVNYTVSNVTTVDSDTVSVNFASVLPAGTYTVNASANTVEDAQGNDSAAFTTTVVVPGTNTAVDSELLAPATVGSNNNTFTIDFNEELAANALNASSYRLDGQALPAGTDIYFSSAAKEEVVIVLPEGSVNIGNVNGGTPAVLTILNVADKVGNVVPTTNYTVSIEDNTSAKITAVQVAGDVVVVTFNETLNDNKFEAAAFDASEVFNVTVGGTTATAGSIQDVDGNDNQLKFQLSQVPTGTVSVTVKAGQVELTDANGYVVK